MSDELKILAFSNSLGIEFNGQDLTGEKILNPETGKYEDNQLTYDVENGDLVVTDKETGELISEASNYVDSNGNSELVADLLLAA